MAIHTPIQSENREALACANALRLAERAKIYADSLKDVASAQVRYIRVHLRELSELRRLELLDALMQVFDSEAMENGILSDMDDLRCELGLDEEGYPTNSDGETIPGADRHFIPLSTSQVERVLGRAA